LLLSSQVGQHQHSNAAAAVRALLWLREQEGLAVVDDAAIRKGLECASLAVRFQVLVAPMQSVAGPGIVVLDGAHTPAAAKSLVTTLRQAFLTQQIALVVAMACDKVRHGCLYCSGWSSLY
jgi:dihydrofolate synthase/folylpolyglutamate synthase